ncbi:hypothetical protein THASP1DRAFT_28382 [Thamnocephalis sphaerospora]|uniref:Uncharacterized protein n=1 Tax=Thamnocephalis sphaerospora TaxID=78915 RepID=A0A4P9XUD1_9FUNG|nr:hypothetical protein THASP1DRAFT_28382 [Thamnocephalis sphaerospora]|eukprot:RKP09834.1 hypothetical protein THASP1DRAFT_28382 [Thamnocephalis sphaerospora]
MTTASTSAPAVRRLYRSFLRLVDQWPNDPLRPKANFRVALRQAVHDRFRAPGDAADIARRVRAADEQQRALELLLSNHYKQESPLSSRTLRPAGNPTYYDKLLRELERVQRGEGGRPGFLDRLFSR